MLKMKDRQTRSIICLTGFSEEANQNNEIDLLLKTIIQFFSGNKGMHKST